MILFRKKHLCASNYFQYIFHIIQLKFPKFYSTRPEDSKVLSPYLNHMRKFCKVKPIHRNHVFGMTVFYQFHFTGKQQGLICHDEKVAYLTFEGRKEAKKIVKTTFLQKK